MKNKKSGCSLFISLLLAFAVQAQRFNETTPLHQFFKTHYDSAIIYFNWVDGYGEPNYYILAKKEQRIWFFTYTSPYQEALGRDIPGGLTLKFIQEHFKFSRTLPDTNHYFRPYAILYHQRLPYWQGANAFDIWKLTSTNNTDTICDIYDAAYDTYYLITKEGVRTLQFYASDYFEECEPSNHNRVQQIKTREFIRKLFQNK